eukprot:m.13888 g.13888  ORF g.13888 m.13888 type:complete len:930 (+) comp3329_c0_seq2:3-2792(+)
MAESTWGAQERRQRHIFDSLPSLPSPAVERQATRAQNYQGFEGFGSPFGARTPAAAAASSQSPRLAGRYSMGPSSTPLRTSFMPGQVNFVDESGMASPVSMRPMAPTPLSVVSMRRQGAADTYPDQSVVSSRYGDEDAEMSAVGPVGFGTDVDVNVVHQFTEILRGGVDPFECAQQFYDTCEHKVQELEQALRMLGKGARGQAVASQLHTLKLERNTWRLICVVYRERWETERKAAPMVDLPELGQSDRSLVNDLLESDSELRHIVRVVEWLEEIAQLHYSEHVTQANYESDNVRWQETLTRLIRKRDRRTDSGARETIEQMDPDAPARTQLPLADVDQEDESRLMKKLFTLVRTGQIDEACRLCQHVGQPWRAASLEGFRLWHDPNPDPAGLCDVEGNWHRDIWKSTCLLMSEDESFDLYERAIYAALTGNLSLLLRVCSTWEDALWAHFKSLADHRIERHLRMFPNPQRHELVELPPNYSQDGLTPEHIFQELRTSPTDAVRTGADDPAHLLQSWIIMGDIPSLITKAHTWIANKDDTIKPYLRFLAHLVIFFRDADVQNLPAKMCEEILHAYVMYLIETDEEDVIASYTAQLPTNVQVELYALFLQRVRDKARQKRCLDLAEEAGLNVAEITKRVVESIRATDDAPEAAEGQATASSQAEGGNQLSESDRQKIEAIDWLVFDPAQRAEALIQSNAVMRSFLVARKTEAATEVFTKIPSDSIAVVNEEWRREHGTRPLAPCIANAIKEYLCIQLYLDSQNAFNVWSLTVNNMRPIPPEDGPVGSYRDEIASGLSQERYENECRRWQANVERHSETAISKLWNVLLFPNGWLEDTEEDTELADRAQRAQQLKQLRQTCIPETLFCLHHVLHEIGQYRECLKLADYVASTEAISAVFAAQKADLRKFLLLLRSSSLAILEHCSDPLGYS